MKKAITISDDQQGWAKLQRSLLDSPIIKNPNLLQIYIWSLLKANHKAKWVSINGKEVHCDVGQFITGRKVAAEELGMKEGTYYSNIKKLKEYGYLEIESSNKFSIVTVVNYRSVAPSARPMEQQKKKERRTKPTSIQQQYDTNNNEKKENNKNNINRIDTSLVSSNIENLSGSGMENDKARFPFIYTNTLIRESYPRVAKHKNQLTFEEFKLLYSQFYWEDIIGKIEELDEWEDLRKQKSIYKILHSFLSNGYEVEPMGEIEENQFEVEEKWFADTDKVDRIISRYESKSYFKDSHHFVDKGSQRHFIRQYLLIKKAFADDRYLGLKKLKRLTIKEAVQFDEYHIAFWSGESSIEEMNDFALIKEFSSTYELLSAYDKQFD